MEIVHQLVTHHNLVVFGQHQTFSDGQVEQDITFYKLKMV
jgi:hypothetical protein